MRLEYLPLVDFVVMMSARWQHVNRTMSELIDIIWCIVEEKGAMEHVSVLCCVCRINERRTNHHHLVVNIMRVLQKMPIFTSLL